MCIKAWEPIRLSLCTVLNHLCSFSPQGTVPWCHLTGGPTLERNHSKAEKRKRNGCPVDSLASSRAGLWGNSPEVPIKAVMAAGVWNHFTNTFTVPSPSRPPPKHSLPQSTVLTPGCLQGGPCSNIVQFNLSICSSGAQILKIYDLYLFVLGTMDCEHFRPALHLTFTYLGRA